MDLEFLAVCIKIHMRTRTSEKPCTVWCTNFAPMVFTLYTWEVTLVKKLQMYSLWCSIYMEKCCWAKNISPNFIYILKARAFFDTLMNGLQSRALVNEQTEMTDKRSVAMASDGTFNSTKG